MGSGRGLPSLSQIQQQFGFIRFYLVQTLVNDPSEESSFLLPPKGHNSMALLYASKEMRRLAGEFFALSGLLFVVKPHEHEIDLQKQADGVAVSFPLFELVRHAPAHGFLHGGD